MKMPVRNMRSWLGMWFVLLAVFPLLLVAILDYQSHLANIKSTAEFKLTAVRDLKILFVEKWFDERIGDLTMLSQSAAFQSLAERYDREKHIGQDMLTRETESFLRNIIANYQAYDAAFLLDGGSGRIVMSTVDHMQGRTFPMKEFLAEVAGSSEVQFSDFHHDLGVSKHEHFHVAINISLPVGDEQRKSSLILLLNIDLDASLYPMLSDRTGLGESGETFILRTDGMALSRLRWQQHAPLRFRIGAEPALHALTGKTGFVIADDYRGVRVAAAYSWLPRLEWGFVAKQDYDELTAPLRSRLFTMMLWIIVAMALVVVVGLGIARGLARPLRSMAMTANRVAEGDMDIRLPSSKISELHTFAKAFNKMVDTVDTELRSGRQSAAVTSGLVTHDSTPKLAEQVCRDLVNVCNAMLGVFYLYDEHSRSLRPISAVGISHTKLPALDARHPSGTLAHALLSEDVHVIHGLDSPEIRFETIAGVARPSEIATLPFLVDGRLLGAVILARATAFTKSDIRTIRRVLPELAFALERIIRDGERERLSRDVKEKNQELETMTEELQQQAEELQLQNQSLEEQQRKLELAYAEKSSFLSNMSHELRTPLNAVLTLGHALRLQLRERITEEEDAYLGVIERNGKQLLEIINDMLELSRLDSGKHEWELESVDPAAIAGHIVEGLHPLADNKGLELTVNAAEDLPTLYVERRAVEMILQNLIGNAIKFTESGGRVEVEIHAVASQLHMVVRDTGIGIPEEHLVSIFEEFQQVDSSARRKFDGVGLGLAIAMKAARRLGGNIQVHSTPGEGSEFIVTLPVQRTRAQASHRENKRRLDVALPKPAAQASEHIMIIDDSDMILDQLRILLVQDGYEVTTMESGTMAVDALLARPPDGVLLDLMIPDVSGFDILSEMRKFPTLRDIPVVVITAYQLNQRQETLLREAQVSRVLIKGSFDEENLLQAVYAMFDNE